MTKKKVLKIDTDSQFRKTFFFVTNEEAKLVSVYPWHDFLPRLIFASKAGAYLKGAPEIWLYDKHSSLFCPFWQCRRKKVLQDFDQSSKL